MTSFRADPPEPDDETLRRVVAELRRPVPLGPGIDQRALAAIRAGRDQTASRPRRWWLGAAAAMAALAASLLLVVRHANPPAATGREREVVLRLVAPASSAVVVVGDFNDWSPVATPLQPTASGEWTVRLDLRPGRYRYTFLVDGREWKSDPAEPPAPDNDYGPPTSVLTVT
ncbi:MAG TPA: hypothetical protein VIE46_04800 [Gemmatimonadales bacterium]